MTALQQPLALAIESANPVTMASPTTTYPFSYTTYTNPSPSPFRKPTEIPSGIFSFGPVMSCSANSAAPSASAMPSNSPFDRPLDQRASCVISNAIEASDHAFWDMYACCQSRNITSLGKPLPCTAQCYPDGKQTWQDLGECLSKRVSIVVCKPDSSEIGKDTQSSSSSRPSNSAAASSATRAADASPTGNSGATSSVATAAASSMDVAHATFSKAGFAVFALVAVSSVAGMFL